MRCPEGTGPSVIEAGGPADVAVALVLIAGVAFTREPVAAGPAVVVAIGLTVVATRRLGGITGDVLGGVVELGELAILLAASR